MSYQEACKWRKYSTFLAAVLLIVIGIFSILSISDAGGLRAIVMTIYLIVIAVVMILVELGQGASQKTFLFLNFWWGKLLLNVYLFAAILSNPEKSWIEWVIAISLLLSSIMNIFIEKKYHNEETQRVKEAIENIQKEYQ